MLLTAALGGALMAQTPEEADTLQVKPHGGLLGMVKVDRDPMFPGGGDSLQAFLDANLSYPEAARRDSVEGLVTIAFTLLPDGTVAKAEALNDIGAGCAEEALRVVGMMPRWVPCIRNGRPTSMRMEMPVRFSLSAIPADLDLSPAKPGEE